MKRDPRTPAEWQAAVDAAEACLLLESARLYCLVVGGPGVDVRRCESILERGRAQGIVPIRAGVDAQIEALVAGSLPRGTSPPTGGVSEKS
jgi:hypothetical protein